MKIRIKSLFAALLLTLSAVICANAQYLDGTLDSGFYGSPLYVQTINTGFGNSYGGGDADGSELDAVYAKVFQGNLYLFITGCLQNNGNVLNVFVGGGGGGESTLQVPTGYELGNMNGSVFPPGFQATWAFDMNDYYGVLYNEEYTLTGTPSGGYVGPLYEYADGLAAGSDGGAASLFLNNTLTSTMGDPGTVLSGSSSGTNATTGLEMIIPISAIGYTSGPINVLICISGSGDDYLSNQFLPGLPVGTGNLGGAAFNFPTNYVTFQLDMSQEVAVGNFVNTDENTNDPGYGQPYNSVAVGGIAGDWGTDHQLTNYTLLYPNDQNPGIKTNLYIGTFPLLVPLPATLNWKFMVNNLEGGFEMPASTAGQNRTTTITQRNTVLPVMAYDDLGPYDFTLSNITVNFSVLVTNGTMDNTGYAFEKGSDLVFINGAWLDWQPWGFISLPWDQVMSEVGNSDIYTNSFVVPKGTSLCMNYKYSFDGVDDENGYNTNHVREIRTYGPTYSFPRDVWSWTVLQPGNGNPSGLAGLAVTNLVEPDFGYLKIGHPPRNSTNLPVTWLGRPGVLLQNVSNVRSGAWNSLSGTDGTQSTNWPNTSNSQFFRLVKKSSVPNLLADPGFETQMGWTLFGGATYSQNYPQSGSWSMLDAASDGVPGCYQQFPASGGRQFEMTGYGFTPTPLTGNPAYGVLQIAYFDNSGNNLGTVETSPGNALASKQINSNTPAGVWTFLDTGVATAPPNTAYVQVFALYVGFSGIDEGVYFDDMSLVRLN